MSFKNFVGIELGRSATQHHSTITTQMAKKKAKKAKKASKKRL